VGHNGSGSPSQDRASPTWCRAGAGWCNTSRVPQADPGGLRYIKLGSAIDMQAQARLVEFGVVHTGLSSSIYKLRKSAPSLHELSALR